MTSKSTTRLFSTFAIFALLSACGSSDSDDGTSATVPDAPTIVSVTPGDASANVAFTAPASDGGAAIFSYESTCIAGAGYASATGASSPITVTGLTNDNTYDCSVTATNSAGTSSASSLVPVTPEVSAVSDADFEAADWTEASHSKDADPNHDEVFDDTLVKRFDFVITPDRWQSMLDDMTATYGEFGQSSGPGLVDTDEDPIFVPADVYYNGTQWYRVGIRFKGNSSLQGSWQRGILKNKKDAQI